MAFTRSTTACTLITVTIPWRAPILRLLLLYPFVAVWAWLPDNPRPQTVATMSAVFCVLSLGGRPSTWRQWTARITGWALAIGVPPLPGHAVSALFGHHWYELWPAAFLGATMAVYGYAAITRIPGFEQPEQSMPRSAEPAMTAPRLWTPAERATSFDDRGQVVFRRSYPIIFNSLFFGLLTFICVAPVTLTLSDHEWPGAAIAVVVFVFLGRTTFRSFRLVVIADDDGLLVRNLQRTHRVAWTEVGRIVPPSADGYGYLRIERRSGRPIRCTALAKSTFQRRFGPDQTAERLAGLVGPALVPAEAVV